jgi:hypothetical protein
MVDGLVWRGVVVARSAPWRVLAGTTLVAGLLFGLAAWVRHHEVALLVGLLAVGTCAAAAGYVFDEESGDIADATPTSRPGRMVWRLPIALLLVLTAVGGLAGLHRLDPQKPWLRLVPVVVGGVAVGLALSAALRRRGNPAPGDLAAVVTLCAVVSVVLVDPLRAWVSLTGFQGPGYAPSTAFAWVVIVLACAVVVLACEADPGRAPRRRTPRKDTD